MLHIRMRTPIISQVELFMSHIRTMHANQVHRIPGIALHACMYAEARYRHQLTTPIWTHACSKLRTALSHQESSASISMPAYEPQYELEAYVVALRYPAAPQGVLQAMVRRLQAGGCSAAVFTMPALQASLA